MKLAIIGYGRLGKAVGEAWENAGGQVTQRITSKDSWNADSLDCDFVLESSTPKSASKNIASCVEGGLPVIVGTTGWHSDLALIEKLVEVKNGIVFHATNFSIGVHLLNSFASKISKTMAAFNNYTPSIEESHHIHKLDKPSGTAITLANKVEIAGGYSDLVVESVREGEIIGIHELKWDSDIDSISIKHEAKNRLGFALGAVRAANWTIEQKSKGVSGVFTMDDMIRELI